MPLDPRTLAELERLGVNVVRGILANPSRSGSGRGATVRLEVAGMPDPNRGEVEDWLAAQDATAAGITGRRHDQLLFWARAATIAAIVAAIASVISLFH